MGFPFFSSDVVYEIQVNFSVNNITYYWNHTLKDDKFIINLPDECRGLALGSEAIYFQVKLPNDESIQFADSGTLGMKGWGSLARFKINYISVESYSDGSPFINDVIRGPGSDYLFRFTTYIDNIANGATLYFDTNNKGPIFSYSIVPRGYNFIL